MRYRQKWIWALSLLACLSPITQTQAVETARPEALANANHIFNAIHSTMRHWGSSIYPNGMSYFLASVPKGTRFYHGTGLSQPITGLEWLAFKPEHSLGFAHRSGRKFGLDRRNSGILETAQQPFDGAQDNSLSFDFEWDGHGYLHTYAAARDLRLLYIDGMSAGPGGSMESQDRILFKDSINGSRPVSGPRLGGPPSDQQRAIRACQLAKEEWGGRIDGIVRTEADFEIILCAFERDLEVVQITQTKPQGNFDRGGPKRKPPSHKPGGPGRGTPHSRPGGDYWSLAARFDEVLGHQVRLDFDHFITAYTYDIDLFPQNATRPRLDHLPQEQLEPIRRDINRMVRLRKPSLSAFNWQSVTDMIVLRYSDELQALAAGNFSSLASLRAKTEQLLEPFMDYRDLGSREVVVDRCQNEFIPTSAPVDTLGAQAVRSISRRVCSSLASGSFDRDVDLDLVVAGFRELVSFLGWTTWKK